MKKDMTDEEWEEQRKRAILAAFQTGRPVFADTDGELHYTDGSREQVPAADGMAKVPIQTATETGARAQRASHRAYVTSIVAAMANGVAAFWHPWQIAVAAVLVGSAVVWRRVNRAQRALLQARSTDDHR